MARPRKVAPARTEGQRLLAEHPATLEAIAEVCVCAFTMPAKWRSGSSRPSAAHRAAMERAFGIPASSWELAPTVTVPRVAARPVVDVVANADRSTLAQVDARIAAVESMLADGLAVSDWAKFSAELTRLLALRHTIEDSAATRESRIVQENPEWTRIRRGLVNALAKYPDAMRAAVAFLSGGTVDATSDARRFQR
jgi:transcriptional regulator with XRE-family HTH domain